MIRAILFDLDETLLDDNRAYDLAIAAVRDELWAAYPQFNFSDLFEVYRQVSNDYWREVGPGVMRGEIEGEAVRLEGWRRALSQYGCDDSLAAVALTSYARLRVENYALFEDASEVLEALPAGMRTAIITNGSGFHQREKVQRTGLHMSIEALFVSGDVGVTKPDAAIFEMALDRLEVSADEAIHVGDNIHADVQGALNARLGGAVWLNRRGKTRADDDPQPHHEIASLRQLLGLLAT